ncbi:MAG: CCA tRNA nucleotidyltransferase, partial [Armatimonadetes bacterium]|nr:CCA tRNA nucleotidyltransferase [Armatimonadota bacterium]
MLTNPDIQHPTLEIVRAAIEGTPYEGCIWLVGGAVRDALLFQKKPSDLDFVLEGDALEVAKWLWEQGVSEIFPVTYPRFGTAMVQINGDKVELVCARKEQYQPGSRKPDVVPATLLDDARRRDFTANALFWNVSRSEIFDPLGSGINDLHAKILRTPLDPVLTFREDPLRMLRAVRFRYQLGFEPVPELTQAIKAESHRLSIISMERIREEFCKMLLLAKPSQPMQDLADLGLLTQFAPELAALQGVEQGSYHHLDVWGHTLLALDNILRQDLYLRLAALFHDVAKPQTKFVDEAGKMRFFGHESIGADITAEVLNRLKFSNDEIKHVKTLVRNHMRLGSSPTFSPTA